MGNLKVNTTKLKQSGNDIIELSNELDLQFESLVSRISNMNKTTLEWVGPSSNEYIRRINIEKIQYDKIVNTLKKYGKALKKSADDYETKLKNLGVDI